MYWKLLDDAATSEKRQELECKAMQVFGRTAITSQTRGGDGPNAPKVE